MRRFLSTSCSSLSSFSHGSSLRGHNLIRNTITRSFFSGTNPFSDTTSVMDKLKMAADVKKKADAMNAELSTAEIKALDPTGLAQVTVSGLGAPLRVIVSPDLAKKSATEISLAVTQASIKAHAIAATQMSEKISKIYADAGLPLPTGGLPKL